MGMGWKIINLSLASLARFFGKYTLLILFDYKIGYKNIN